MKGKMAIIGDGDSILVFSAIGIDSYPVEDAENAKEILKSIYKTYQIIFMTDNIAKSLGDYLDKYLSVAYPIIITLPSKNGSNGYGEEVLLSAMEKALGVNLFVNENKDEKDGQ